MQINFPTFLIQRSLHHPCYINPSSPFLSFSSSSSSSIFCSSSNNMGSCWQTKKSKNMGSQNKPTTIDGVDGKVAVDPPSPTTLRPYHLLLRFLAFALTLIATFIVGLDKETKTISFYAGLRFQATAHWKYMSAFVYFLVANAIACSYGAASLVITEVAARRSNDGNNLRLRLAVTTSDLVIMALLFSANGAAGAIGMIGQKGNSHVHWMKVCDEFTAYCRHMTTAVVLSLVGSTVFLGLVALSLLSDSTNRTPH